MILFISDLHLSALRPQTTAAFSRFLAGPARDAKELWILGDLFDFWVGDDDLSTPLHAQIADELAELASTGVTIRIITGNRDFLLGSIFSARAGARVLPEPSLLEAEGRRLVLVHGDAQCTDDLAYQRYRRRIRSPVSRIILRLLPLRLRRRLAMRIRERSESMHAAQSASTYDLNTEALADLFRTTSADVMIHGHTHLHARHELEVDGKPRIRWVLADWHAHATWLELGPQGFLARSELDV